MNDSFLKRQFRMPRSQIAYLRFILESYDGLAFVSTIDREEALVEVHYPGSRREDAEALLEALSGECFLEPVEEPHTRR